MITEKMIIATKTRAYISYLINQNFGSKLINQFIRDEDHVLTLFKLTRAVNPEKSS